MLSYAIHLRGAFSAEIHAPSAFPPLLLVYQALTAYDCTLNLFYIYKPLRTGHFLSKNLPDKTLFFRDI